MASLLLSLAIVTPCESAALDFVQAFRQVESWKDWSEPRVIASAQTIAMFILPPNPHSPEGLRERAGALIELAQGNEARRRYEQAQRRARERVWRALARVEQACKLDEASR